MRQKVRTFVSQIASRSAPLLRSREGLVFPNGIWPRNDLPTGAGKQESQFNQLEPDRLDILQASIINRGPYRLALTTDKLPGLENPNTVIITEWDPRLLNALMVFPIFGPRLKTLKQEMLNWKPRDLVELFPPGYTSSYAYYTTFLAAIIGSLTITQTVLTTFQVVHTVTWFALLAWGVLLSCAFIVVFGIFGSRLIRHRQVG